MLLLLTCIETSAQNIFPGEPVQVVGPFNGYATEPYGLDYRTTQYRRVTTNMGSPTDGRGQWHTTIHAQNPGGDIFPIAMLGGPGDGFLFISGPNSNRFQNKWVFNDVAQATVDQVNVATCYNCGNDMGLDMSIPGYYTFVFNDCGYTAVNAQYYVGRTSNPPVQPSRSSETLNNDGSVTVGITLNVPKSPEEKVYLFYSTSSDFTAPGSGIVEATGAGVNYTATTPIFADGTVIYYNIFTSTRDFLDLILDFILRVLLSILRLDDNNGNNYSTTTNLPVEMTSFTARTEGETVALEWSTATESNNDRFEVERSADGITFDIIGSVKGAGYSQQTHAYQFTDQQPSNGINYYRLKQVDLDGRWEYSGIVSAVAVSDVALTVLPNPATADEIRIDGLVEPTSFIMRSLMGQSLLQGTLYPGQPIDISRLPQGQYLIQTAGQVLRFVKQ